MVLEILQYCLCIGRLYSSFKKNINTNSSLYLSSIYSMEHLCAGIEINSGLNTLADLDESLNAQPHPLATASSTSHQNSLRHAGNPCKNFGEIPL